MKHPKKRKRIEQKGDGGWAGKKTDKDGVGGGATDVKHAER